ncbi:MAG: 50S ribosomal protein L18 [Candidatus Babeliales bacterium]
MLGQRKIKKRIQRRKLRVSEKMKSHIDKARISVFRSLKHIAIQLVAGNKTVASASTMVVKQKENETKTQVAFRVGEHFGKHVLSMNQSIELVFDRGPYKYHGRVKAIAEGIRSVGLKF